MDTLASTLIRLVCMDHGMNGARYTPVRTAGMMDGMVLAFGERASKSTYSQIRTLQLDE